MFIKKVYDDKVVLKPVIENVEIVTIDDKIFYKEGKNIFIELGNKENFNKIIDKFNKMIEKQIIDINDLKVINNG